ncbi:hypothetical protein, partial [Vibrio parahaemolyticus]|uniref:hypothetical protein n=1 Tax=Vibrio parahaemolyticus TaxID=670 RepID=UPI0022B5119E
TALLFVRHLSTNPHNELFSNFVLAVWFCGQYGARSSAITEIVALKIHLSDGRKPKKSNSKRPESNP